MSCGAVGQHGRDENRQGGAPEAEDDAGRLRQPGADPDPRGHRQEGEAGLERTQKIEILKRWESDARQLMVASDENMAGGEHQQLQAVQEALRSLGAANSQQGDQELRH